MKWPARFKGVFKKAAGAAIGLVDGFGAGVEKVGEGLAGRDPARDLWGLRVPKGLNPYQNKFVRSLLENPGVVGSSPGDLLFRREPQFDF